MTDETTAEIATDLSGRLMPLAPTATLDYKKRYLAELERRYGPNDGAVTELKARIEKEEEAAASRTYATSDAGGQGPLPTDPVASTPAAAPDPLTGQGPTQDPTAESDQE